MHESLHSTEEHAGISPDQATVYPEASLTRSLPSLQAQRRFRERQKTKFVELNTRVEELEGVIGDLLSEKTRLEDRTSFLEKALECRRSSIDSNASAMPRSASQARRQRPVHACKRLACQCYCTDCLVRGICAFAGSAFQASLPSFRV